MYKPTMIRAMLLMLAFAGLLTAQPSKPLRLGLDQSMLPPDEEKKFDVVADNFKEVLMQQAQLAVEPEAVKSSEEMYKLLADGSMQLGAFPGFQFAWMKEKQSDLEPLILAVPIPDALVQLVVVAKDNPAKSLSDLRGTKLALSKEARQDTRHYLDQRTRQLNIPMKELFPEQQTTATAEEALDSVVDGSAKVAAVDRGVLRMLERRKPGRAAKLRVLEESAPFLPPVIACAKGKLDPTIAQRFRDGMVNAHTTPKGGHLVRQIKIVKFELIPADFEKLLESSRKSFPPP